MKSNTIVMKIAAALMLVAILTGCTGGAKPTFVMPTQDQKPTFEAIQTQAVMTAIAGMTQNAPAVAPTQAPAAATETLAPTQTTEPTATLVVLPSFTPVIPTPIPPTAIPTWTFVPRTNTPTGYACTITSQAPAFAYDFPPGGDFDGKWVVKNTGTITWDSGQIDIRYLSGTKFQGDKTIYDLGANVAKGDSTTIIIDMLAPNTPGRYTASWALTYGTQVICPLSVTIDVK